jgi:hypothetical protein
MGQGHAATAAPLAAVLISLLLGGCSGTAFGDRLAGSFSAAPASPPAAPASTGPRSEAPAASESAGQPAASGGKPAQPQPATTTKNAAKPAAAVTLEPAPYRITIKLPSGDPSAPAEVVTQALRAAGVAFEVEMIERVSTAAPGAAPLPQPAPAPRPR